MRKVIRCCLIAAAAALMMSAQVHVALASEEPTGSAQELEKQTEQTEQAPAQTEQPEQTEQTPAQTEQTPAQKVTPGWNTIGGYKFFYTSNGTMITGWARVAGKWYYLRETEQGTFPKGSMAVGFVFIRGKRFFFDNSGCLHAGWRKFGDKYYYFEEKGGAGVLGRTYVGYKTIGNHSFLFGANGAVLTGWQKYGKYMYYCQPSGKLGEYGSVLAGGWKTVDGDKYYFTASGAMLTNRWIWDMFYVDASGKLLTDCVTKDGWIVNVNGRKVKKASSGWVTTGGKTYFFYSNGVMATGWRKLGGRLYYFDSTGVRQEGMTVVNGRTYYLKGGLIQRGWITIDKKKYYFGANGVMVTNQTVDGIKLGPDGAAEVKAKILLISGHGQGDPGATSTMKGKRFQEYQYTREFASLIYSKLKEKGTKIDVTLYDQNYDCYQVNKGSKSGPDPHFTDYDYVLEIHFDAAVRDYSGNGKYTGVSILVSSSKKDISLDSKIVNAVAATGFKKFSSGVIRRSDLLNMNTCNKKGVSYALLETAFIDDWDDMSFYNNHKNSMADAVVNTLIAHFD